MKNNNLKKINTQLDLKSFIYSCFIFMLMGLACLFFTACGNKYENLDMSFFVNNNEVEKIELVIDNEKEYSSLDVKIKFDGISSNDIGQVIVYSSQSGLIEITNYRYLENSCLVKISATGVGEAKLNVKHLASNKEESVELSILKKSTGLRIDNSNYVVSIPDENEKEITFKTNEVLTLLPNGSSDKVLFKIESALPEGVEGVYYLKNGQTTQYITSLKIKATVSENSQLKLTPVTILESGSYSYDFDEHTQQISVNFIKSLNVDNLTLTSSSDEYNYTTTIDGTEKTLNYVENNETIRLVYNDVDKNKNAIVVEFKGEIDKALRFYKVKPISSDPVITVAKLNEMQYLIQADGKTSKVAKVDFEFTPYDCVGDISSFVKTFNVESVTRADSVDVFMPKSENPRTAIDLNETIEIFDYYSQGDTRGAQFNFKPVSYDGGSVYSNLGYMQIIVDPKIINLKAEDVYSDSNFVTKTNNSLDGICSAKYVLDLFWGSNPMRFYYSNGQLVSEEFSQSKSVYVKYFEKDAGQEEDLKIQVKTTYKGNLNYLNDVTPANIELSFKNQAGVRSISLQSGVENGNEFNAISNFDQFYIERNREEFIENGVDTEKIYSIQLGGVYGLNDKNLTNIDLDLIVTPLDGQINNLLRLKYNDGTLSDSKLTITYSSGYNYIYLVYDENTEVGDYQIDIVQSGSGYRYNNPILVHVYKAIDDNDLTKYTLSVGDYIKNIKGVDENSEKIYEYSNYHADYIVAASQNPISLDLNINETLINSKMISSYEYSYEIVNQNDEENKISETAQYFTCENNNQRARLTFNRGTSKNSIIYIIRLTSKVKTDFYKLSNASYVKDEKSGIIDITFYVYEKISDDMISINHTRATKYIKDYLGAYNIEDSKLDLAIDLNDSNLWQYVQEFEGTNVVEWRFENEEELNGAVDKVTENNSKMVNLTFNSYDEDIGYDVLVTGYIKQFGVLYKRECRVEVKKPIISDRVDVTSKTLESSSKENRYINLKVGERYKIEAECISNDDSILSNPGIEYVVVKNKSRSQNSVYIEHGVDGTNIIVASSADSNIQIIIFAKDALKYTTDSVYNYSNIESMLLDGHENAYFIIDVIISDGTQANPYLITTKEDFINIKNVNLKDVYYQLMNDVDLTNTNFEAVDLNSNLITPKDENDKNFIYTISGISLSNTSSNLFKTVAENASISGIRFVVYFNYSLSSVTIDTYFGLIGQNYGQITNCSVLVLNDSEISYAQTNSSTYYTYFGALVGENRGEIEFNNNVVTTINGVEGNLKLSGTAQNLYIGGLVGHNLGEIVGTYELSNASANEYLFTSAGNYSSALNISGEIIYDSNSAVGGLVGLNDYANSKFGTISGVEVNSIINLPKMNNVGGIIGCNKFDSQEVTIETANQMITSYSRDENLKVAVSNSKSTAIILANNNIGGIVGNDENGIYSFCQYQILDNNTYSYGLSGNSYIGGLVGISTNGKFENCSVYGYRWNYSDILNSSFVACETGEVTSNNFDLLKSQGVLFTKSETNYEKVSTTAVYNETISYYKMTDFDIVGQSNTSGFAGNLNTSQDNEYSVIFNSSVNAKIDNKSGNSYGVVGGGNNYGLNVYFNGFVNGVHSAQGVISPSADAWNRFYSNFVFINGSVYAEKYEGRVGDNSINNRYSNLDTKFQVDDLGSSWIKIDNINGGLPVIKNSSATIFELAPQTLSAIVKEVVKIKNGYKKVDDSSVVLFFYNPISSLDYSTLTKLNNEYNMINLLDDDGLLTLSTNPTNLGQVRLKAEIIGGNNVVEIVGSMLVVKGVGECTLKISSILNPNAYAEIKIVVVAPIQTISVLNTNTNSKTLEIRKGESDQFLIKSNTSVEIDNKQIEIAVDSSSYLEISIDGTNVSEYITLYGLNRLNSSNCKIEGSKFIYTTTEKRNSIIIRALEQSENEFNFTIKPFIIVNSQKVYLNKDGITFNVKTLKGPTDIYLTYDYAVIYPNDETTIIANITTDYEINDENIESYIENILIDNSVVASSMITVLSSEFYQEKQLERVVFKLDTSALLENKLDEKQVLTINFNVNGLRSSVDFTLLKQRIDAIDVRNYVYKDDAYSLEDVLKPATKDDQNGGIISIDLVPNNAYYDYIEITDLTTGEEITFVQVEVTVDDDGKWVITPKTNVELSSDGKGIKLKKDGLNTVYARTQIDSKYPSRPHTIKLTPFVEDPNGNMIELPSVTKDIEVKILPTIVVQYVLPNGDIKRTLENETRNINEYLANGTTANFIIDTYNSDGNIDVKISSEDLNDGYYKLVNDYGHFYSLVCEKHNSQNSGKEFTIEFSTTAMTESGDYETARSEITFKLMDFVIHGISVNQSTINSNGEREIYGSYDVEYPLEFYFDTTDISVYDSGTFNETIYRYTDNNTNQILNPIYNILKDINGKVDGGKSEIKIVDKNGNENDDAKFNNHVLVVSKPSTEVDRYLELKFALSPNENHFVLAEINEDQKNYIKYKYHLNFRDIMSLTAYDLVKNEEDFLNMSSGEVNYILGVDLTLENYSPIDISINEFDGNGHTITIKSFADFDEDVILAGLFKQIPRGMVVKNLIVKYESTFDSYRSEYSFGTISKSSRTFGDLCNNSNVNYTAAYFGGITAENYGIISNCQTEGTICLKAGTIQDQSTTGSIAFNIGGLACVNNSDAYITNSISNMKIYGLANIGGFVYQNSGKISSCSFGINSALNFKSLAQINNFVDSEKQIIVDAAGFAVSNTGKISMSYVDLTAAGSNISAKNASAGFVGRNSGTISNSYVKIGENNVGEHGNIFSGFVNNNTGAISNSYSYMLNVSNTMSAFAPETTGLENCIQFVKNISAVRDSDVLASVLFSSNMLQDFVNHKFVFGTDETGIWKFEENSTPTLNSTLINPRYNGTTVNKENKLLYYGLRNIEVEIKEGEKNGVPFEHTKYNVKNNSYGTKTNPITISSVDYWNEHIVDNTTLYYRLIADIDFDSTTPLSSSCEFKGFLEGNSMEIKNFILYSNDSLSGIGLFKSVAPGNSSEMHYIKNISLKSKSIWAAKTKTVGMLAGTIESFAIYNISLDSSNQIIVGGNAVGGLAGIVCGKFDIDTIDSSVSVNATGKATTEYSIYVSKLNNGTFAYNLDDVYYAGGVAGILDGYSKNARSMNIDSSRDISSSSYVRIQNINVSGEVNVLGDSVGFAFGFIGEKVYANKILVNVESGKILGNQYSAGLVGENRGVIDNSTVNISNDVVFTQGSTIRTTSGLCGLNLGGLIQNSTVKAYITNNIANSTVGGIIGRNINGSINNVTFDGELLGTFTGVIIGANYSKDLLVRAAVSKGALIASLKQMKNLIPSTSVSYYNNNSEIKNYKNLIVSSSTIKYFVENSKKFYYFADDKHTFNEAMVKSRVLGMFVGLTDIEDVLIKSYTFEKSGSNKGELKMAVDSSDDSSNSAHQIASALVYVKGGDLTNSQNANKLYTPILNIFTGFDKTNIFYITGAKVSYLDIWNKQYSGEMFMLSNDVSIAEELKESENVKNLASKNVFIILKTFEENFDSLNNKLTVNSSYTFTFTFAEGSKVYYYYNSENPEQKSITDNTLEIVFEMNFQ